MYKEIVSVQVILNMRLNFQQTIVDPVFARRSLSVWRGRQAIQYKTVYLCNFPHKMCRICQFLDKIDKGSYMEFFLSSSFQRQEVCKIMQICRYQDYVWDCTKFFLQHVFNSFFIPSWFMLMKNFDSILQLVSFLEKIAENLMK